MGCVGLRVKNEGVRLSLQNEGWCVFGDLVGCCYQTKVKSTPRVGLGWEFNTKSYTMCQGPKVNVNHQGCENKYVS